MDGMAIGAVALDKQIIAIAGNIGVGKSSLTELLSQRMGWQPFFEGFADNPYLADFYEDMRSWSFHSQVFFLAMRLRHHHAMFEYPGTVIQDRSLYEDAEIFAQNLYEQGQMSERDYATYRSLYQALCEALPPPTLIVYLRATVPTLLARIGLRGRQFEQDISPGYLATLNALYERWVSGFALCPVLTIASDDLDFVHRDEDRDRVVEEIMGALGSEQLRML